MNHEAVYRTAPATPGLLIRREDAGSRRAGRRQMGRKQEAKAGGRTAGGRRTKRRRQKNKITGHMRLEDGRTNSEHGLLPIGRPPVGSWCSPGTGSTWPAGSEPGSGSSCSPLCRTSHCLGEMQFNLQANPILPFGEIRYNYLRSAGQ